MTATIVNAWATDLRAADHKFLPTVIFAIEQIMAGDNTEIAKMLIVAHGKTSNLIKCADDTKTQYATPLKKILEIVCGDRVKYKFAPNKASGVKLTVNVPSDDRTHNSRGVDTDMLEGLRILSASNPNMTVRSAKFKDWIKQNMPEKDTPEKSFDPKAWADRNYKAHPEALDAMIAALQAKRKDASVDH